MKYADGDDDVPVALCIIRDGAQIDWDERLPEEVLYMPESIFSMMFPDLIEKYDANFYGTSKLSVDDLEHMKSSITENKEESCTTWINELYDEILKFISRGESLKGTHYIALEGP